MGISDLTDRDFKAAIGFMCKELKEAVFIELKEIMTIP
jgi:hypothetical protein